MIVVCTAVLCTHLCTHQVYTVQSQCAVEGKVVSGRRVGSSRVWPARVSSGSDREQLCVLPVITARYTMGAQLIVNISLCQLVRDPSHLYSLSLPPPPGGGQVVPPLPTWSGWDEKVLERFHLQNVFCYKTSQVHLHLQSVKTQKHRL